MTWDEVRRSQPNRWVVIEVLQAYTDMKRRIVEDISVVGVFDESPDAMQRYKALHQQFPLREYLIFHTSREVLDVEVRFWNGIRSAR
jgi:hypothetical protein